MCDFLICKTEDALDLDLPRYMTEQASGMDLTANVHEDIIIGAGEIMLVPTGIKIALPVGYEAQIRPRSGLAIKHGISIVNSPGTIDGDFRGEIQIIIINHGKEPFRIKRGDRIAQMVVCQAPQITWKAVDKLDETIRGEGGFGHTGK